jgi:hypothetical protein
VKTLNECVDSGDTIVVELSDHRHVMMERFDPNEDDSLADNLLANNTEFQAMVDRSLASGRKPFVPRHAAD